MDRPHLRRQWLGFVFVCALCSRADAQAKPAAPHDYFTIGGVPQNPGRVFEDCRMAAENGDIDSMARLGEYYEKGGMVAQDIPKAIEWYKKALAAAPRGDSVPFIAGSGLVRLSNAGLTIEKYGGIGGRFWVLDDKTPTKQLVRDLSQHTETFRTGKADLIGYNQWMLSIASRGESTLPFLEDFVKHARSTKARMAGILTIHLVGLECAEGERLQETFRSRAARQVFWRLLKIESLTDDVVRFLKRDPWPEDVPIIMDVLSKAEGDCLATLGSLHRYFVPDCPLDFVPLSEVNRPASFVSPAEYSLVNYIRSATDGLRSSGYEVHFTRDAFSAFSDQERSLSKSEPRNWSGTVYDLLVQVKGAGMIPFAERYIEHMSQTTPPASRPALPFLDYLDDGNPVFFIFEPKKGGGPSQYTIRLMGPHSARLRLLEWWDEGGRKRYHAWLSQKPDQ